ncbi:hypothetical protein JCM8547_008606 [Rhodosporidiobolus lusitaniae]
MASPLALPSKSSATTSLSAPSSPSSSSLPTAPSPPPAPPVPPLHLAAQRGDLAFLHSHLAQLSDSQQQDAVNLQDDQGITPLHWAAINGHLVFAKELLRKGAHVDVRGGELKGTSLHWAARNGHLPLVHLLLSHSSDPSLRDSQSFTTLHLSVHSSSAFLLAYLLFTLQPLSLDSPDAEGHTALSWAAYQGDAISVELLLLAGADLNAPDHAGLRPLHWAVTKGNSECIRRLVAAGAELNARTNVVESSPLMPSESGGGGKTAREMAVELKSLAAYNRGLSGAGIDPSTHRPFDVPIRDEKTLRRAIFAVVCAGMGAIFWVASSFAWYVALVGAAGGAYGVHYLVARVLLGVKGGGGGHSHGHGHGHGGGGGGGGGGEKLTKSPYLCAIITGSLGWVAWVWIGRYLCSSSLSLLPALCLSYQPLLPASRAALTDYPLSNLLFFLSLSTCSYTFYRAITLDPGTVKRPRLPSLNNNNPTPSLFASGRVGGGREEEEAGEGEVELKETIESLVEQGQFNGMNFCLTCLVRRPLRSKHSYATGRCVARFDHYCPWVWNDIGVNNHRQFLLFVGSLVVGVVFFIHLTIAYFYERAPDLPPDASCPSLSPTVLCMATSYDSFALLVCLWASLQLTWTVVLLGVQVWQVAKQMTTLEVSNVSRWGYMGGKAGVSGAAQQGYVEKWNAAQSTGALGGGGQAAAHDANAGGGSGDGLEGMADDPESLAHAPSTTRPTTPLPSSASSASLAAGARPTGSFAFLLKLLGLDRFLSTSSSSSSARRRRVEDVSNPFDVGLVGNCVDFWTRGGTLGVEYERVYDVPRGGWKRVVEERRRREREKRERERGKMPSLPLAGEGGRPRGGAGYERVAMEDV